MSKQTKQQNTIPVPVQKQHVKAPLPKDQQEYIEKVKQDSAKPPNQVKR